MSGGIGQWSPPTSSSADLTAMIKRELPGCDFRLLHRTDTFMVEMEIARHVEGKRLAISDLQSISQPESVNSVTGEAIRRLRLEAIRDYGLQTEIDAQIKAAVTEHDKAVMRDLRNYLERFRELVETLDADGESVYVPGYLPRWATHITNWMDSRKARS